MAEPVDDQTIVDGLLRGDPEAQIQLLQAYAEPLVRFLHYTYPVELADAEDIAVETLYKAVERINSFRGSSPSAQHQFRNWLFTIARNLWIDKTRKAPKTVLLAEDEFERVASKSVAEDDVVASPQIMVLRQALAELPEMQRLTLLLHYDGRKLTEIAEILNVSPGNVRQWKNRGLKTLSEQLQNHPVFADLAKE